MTNGLRPPKGTKRAAEPAARNDGPVYLVGVRVKNELARSSEATPKILSEAKFTGAGVGALSGDARHLTIRLSGPLEHDNIVNGYGLRAVLWTQGCKRHCPGCQNPETWDFAGGVEVDVEDVKQKLRALKGQAGITFCGGEPFEQPEACREIAEFCRAELGWNVWSFTGYTYEQLEKAGGAQWEFLRSLDALIDGPFILSERDLTMKFRGSRNQRLLHLEPGTGKILRKE